MAFAIATRAAFGTHFRQQQSAQPYTARVHLNDRLSRPTRRQHVQTLNCRAVASEQQQENGAAAETIPAPVVKIDNHTDPFATVVTVQFGDRLGELLDTIAALKNLGLNIRRARIKTTDTAKNRFFLTDARTSEKITQSKRLEEIRLTILNNLLKYHPESGGELAWGSQKAKRPVSTRDSLNPLGPRNRAVVQTQIKVRECENGSHSEVEIVTTDRPGLLTDIVQVLKDISVNVISAEVDTEGPIAKDFFYVTYHGEPLNKSMVQLVQNTLSYYLSLAEIEREESY